MRSELQSVLDSLREMQLDRLPELLGEIEVVRSTALLRLSTSPPLPSVHDQLLSIEVAAQRLGMSKDYLYRHHVRLPFTRRIGRNLRFSSLGIERYIAQSKLK